MTPGECFMQIMVQYQDDTIECALTFDFSEPDHDDEPWEVP